MTSGNMSSEGSECGGDAKVASLDERDLVEPLLKSDPASEERNLHEEWSKSRATGFVRTSFNSMNLLLGAGVVSLPYAFKVGGLVYTSIILVVLSIVTAYTAAVIKWCLEYSPGLTSFADMGYAAFGWAGKAFITAVFTFELFTACVMYLVLFADNVYAVQPYFSHVQYLIIGTLLIWPQCLTTNLKWLSYFSFLGVTTSVMILGVVVYTSLVSTTQSPSTLWKPNPTLVMFDHKMMPLALGLVMVGFTGHACFPNIYSEMRTKSQYPAVVSLTYGFICVFYAVIGVSGYLTFGASTMKEITLNLQGTIQGDIAVWLVAINPVVRFALTMNPVALICENMLGISQDPTLPSSVKKGLRHRIKWPLSLLLRTCMVGAALGIGIMVPRFDKILALCGSAFSFTVSVVFPVTVYVKLYWSKMNWISAMGNLLLIFSGLVCAAVGTWAAIVL